jgi:regulator of sigma E protease
VPSSERRDAKGRRVLASEEALGTYATAARDAQGRTVYDRGFDHGAVVCRPGEPYVPRVSADEFLEQERGRTYQGLSVPRRLAVLVAGVACNLAFAVVVLAAYCMVCGFYASDGTLVHLGLLDALTVAVAYVADVAASVASLLVPSQTAAVLEDSAGIVGIAAITYEAVTEGPGPVLLLAAMLSVSLGWMNLLPIPPLDGGKVLIELVQAVVRRPVPQWVQNALSCAGLALFAVLFVYMAFQDTARLGTLF